MLSHHMQTHTHTHTHAHSTLGWGSPAITHFKHTAPMRIHTHTDTHTLYVLFHSSHLPKKRCHLSSRVLSHNAPGLSFSFPAPYPSLSFSHWSPPLLSSPLLSLSLSVYSLSLFLSLFPLFLATQLCFKTTWHQ